VSITRRILESAQSGLSKLSSLVIVDDEPLSNVESAALASELAARKAARERAGRAPLDNPLARQALAEPAARKARDEAARARAGRVHRERDARDAQQRAAADDAFRRIKQDAARGGSQRPTSTASSATAGSSAGHTPPRRPPRPGSSEAQLVEWYRVLDVSVDADVATIKTAYRRAMRKYHPDMHAGNPSKLKAATELSVRVTAAYDGLIAHLEKK
jgi:DnaJ-domain-containing protein 1